MPVRLADRIEAARRRRFVGRAPERALFQAALVAPELPFCVLYLFGPGGVGKTTLLQEFAALCAAGDVPAIAIDGRNIDPAPEEFTAALQDALGLPPPAAPLDALAAASRRQVILIDTYETLAPLDTWLRESFLPQLPDNTLIVLAGRNAPAPAWRTDPGWQGMVRALPLRNLSPDESRAYLTTRAVPAGQHAAVLAFTHGHPLALSLVADLFAQRGAGPFQPADAPDIVRALLEELVQKVPGPTYRTALEACALVRLTTEDLLGAILDTPNSHELFDWLRGLSFVESGRFGLFPHDLAREALVADLRWRNPTWYAALHARARSYYATALQQTRDQEQQRVLFDYMFLHRDNLVLRPFFEWQESGTIRPEPLQDGDRPDLLAMVAQHEGAESAWLAEHWLAHQPEGVTLFRDGEGRASAFLQLIALPRTSDADRDRDPAVQAAGRYVQSHAPLRPGETATLFRFWMARDTYQAVSPAQSLIFINVIRHFLTTPGLTYSFLPVADPEFWAPLYAYGDLARIPEVDYTVGGHRFGVYGHDWRAVPPHQWLALLAEREIALSPPRPTPPPAPLVVLSQEGFAGAVHEALRDYSRPDALSHNPLLHSRLVGERVRAPAGNLERAAALQALLKKAGDLLAASPPEAKLYRAVYHTYIRPVPTQEQAAELLDLPFSTFRRHLKQGVTRLAEILWQWELEGLGV
ncbi:MAG TPA: ATP-binding protein [Chloroflexia bacterium]|nr:ATP-binding protein [Chloroflexia bacterium]